jgi:hypothetical protein
VWKYVFAEQNSEQSRIVSEIGVGNMNKITEETEDGQIVPAEWGDCLHLTQKDRRKLEDWLREPIVLTTKKGDKEITDMYNYGKKKLGSDGEKINPRGYITRIKCIKTWEAINNKLFSNGILCGSLEEYLRDTLREALPDIHFWHMVKTYVNYMKNNKRRYDFNFEGEY